MILRKYRTCALLCAVFLIAVICVTPAFALGSSSSSFAGSSQKNSTEETVPWSLNRTYFAFNYALVGTTPVNYRSPGLRPGSAIWNNDRSTATSDTTLLGCSIALLLKDDNNDVYALTSSECALAGGVDMYTINTTGKDYAFGQVVEPNRQSQNRLYSLIKLNSTARSASLAQPFFNERDVQYLVYQDNSNLAGWGAMREPKDYQLNNTESYVDIKYICAVGGGTGLSCGVSVPIVEYPNIAFRYTEVEDTQLSSTWTLDYSNPNLRGSTSSLSFNYGGIIYGWDADGLHPVAMITEYNVFNHTASGVALSYILNDAQSTYGLNLKILNSQADLDRANAASILN